LLIPPEAYELSFPLDSIISISPEAGHVPYSLLAGRSQIAGQIQSPLGSFALTSTLPYLKLNELTDLSLADLTGLITFPEA